MLYAHTLWPTHYKLYSASMVLKNIDKMERPPDLTSPSSETNHHLVSANYSKLSDHIRRLTPQGIQCSVFCGGTNCKYENPENWTADSLAIQGIYSHWITDDILAMARPSTVVIAKKNVIQQFESLGIKSIINLQCPKEHASCGQPLEESGFSYDPNIFMENNIYYYNFAWKDYGDATLTALLDMVKVLAFAISEGRVAVHCHAGLGRTGVLISCFLVYSLRVNANDAIRYVRYRRPGSVQTRGQILCVRHFAQFVLPLVTTYFIKDNTPKDKYMTEFTLQKFLRKQKIILHGYEERNYKYLPKIIHVICEQILKLCGRWVDEFPKANLPLTDQFLVVRTHANIQRHESTYSISSALSFEENKLHPNVIPHQPVSPSAESTTGSFSELSTLDGEELNEEMLMENKCFQELETQKCLVTEASFEDFTICDPSEVVEALLAETSDLDDELQRYIRQLQNEINTSQAGWAKLRNEKNLFVLAMMLYEWLECLKVPVVRLEYLEHIVIYYKQPETCFQKFDIEDAYLVEYLLHFLSKIQLFSKEAETNVIKRLLAALTQRSVTIRNKNLYISKFMPKLRDGTSTCAIEFLHSLAQLIEAHHTQSSDTTDIAFLGVNVKSESIYDFNPAFH